MKVNHIEAAKAVIAKAREMIAGEGRANTGPSINLSGFIVENDSWVSGSVAAATLIEEEVAKLCRMTETPWEAVELYEAAVKELGIANICRI